VIGRERQTNRGENVMTLKMLDGTSINFDRISKICGDEAYDFFGHLLGRFCPDMIPAPPRWVVLKIDHGGNVICHPIIKFDFQDDHEMGPCVLDCDGYTHMFDDSTIISPDGVLEGPEKDDVRIKAKAYEIMIKRRN